jgi:hypothetical protein
VIKEYLEGQSKLHYQRPITFQWKLSLRGCTKSMGKEPLRRKKEDARLKVRGLQGAIRDSKKVPDLLINEKQIRRIMRKSYLKPRYLRRLR